MAIDQVELLTRDHSHTEETHPNDVHNVIESLPVQQPTRNSQSEESILDSVVKETEDSSPEEEGPFIRAFLTGMNWATYVLAIGVVLFLTWAAGDGIMKYLAHK